MEKVIVSYAVLAGAMYALAMSLPVRRKRWQFGVGSLMMLMGIVGLTAGAGAIASELAILVGYYFAGFYCVGWLCTNIVSRAGRTVLLVLYLVGLPALVVGCILVILT